jgi:drug/metabolite transporter (DMT)-like permease
MLSLAGLAGLMMLGSGLIHAIVNAILKSGGDKMSSRALIDGFSALIVLPAAFLLPLPAGAWHWLFLSTAIHLVYLVALIRAFEHGDMGVAYPIARGIAPALAAAVAVGAFHEPVTAWTAAGVALVTVGVLTVGLGRAVDRRVIGWAGLTGVCIALYTVVDAQGVRAAPNAPSYIVWNFMLIGGGIGGMFALWRGPRFLAAARAEWRPGLIAGALSIVTYGTALWALRLAPTPRLAALRETSILFGLVIATVFLKERLTPSKAAGVGLIAAGAGVLLTS